MSQLRSGPATVFCSQHTAGLVHPGAQICGAPGRGKGAKSDPAVGNGLLMLTHTPPEVNGGLQSALLTQGAPGVAPPTQLPFWLLAVKPVNPVSSPSMTRFAANEPFGSSRGPKVRCGMMLFGLMAFSYRLNTATS